MTKFIGRQQSVGIAAEASRGTIVAPTLWLPKVNFSVEDKVAKARLQGNYGVLAGGDDALVAQKWAEGDIEFELQEDTLPLFMQSLFGSLSSSSFNSAYKHTFSLSNSVQHKSLSLHMNDPIGSANSKTISYARSMIKSFELAVKLGEPIMAKIGFIANVHKDYTLQTPSWSAASRFIHKHAVVKIAADTSGLAAASKINVQDLVLTVNKNVIRENSLGTVQPVDILNRKIEITGKMMLTYEDRTYRDYMLNGTKKALRIAIVNSDVTIGSTNPQLQIDLPVVDFDAWDPKSPLDDVATQEIMFTALYDVANSQIIGTNSFVVNDTASY